MYNQQQTSERKLKKLKEKLENLKAYLETKDEIKQYLAWVTLPNTEKISIKKQWDDYFSKVKTTKAFKRYFKMKDAWEKNKMTKIKELANKAKKQIEDKNWELAKPQGIDPWEFSHGICYKYQNVCNQILSLNKQLTGIEDVDEIFDKPKKQYKQPYLD